MVAINRSNVRRVGRASSKSSPNIGDCAPSLSHLSSFDRILLLCGAALLILASFSYFFLLSSILSENFNSNGANSDDPRLSSELRKIGLSKESLLRRGGGKRISVGLDHHKLDSEENAVALDIISALNCDALQEEVERGWKTVLDGQKLKEESNKAVIDAVPEFGFAGSGHVDDFAAELAKEVVAQQDKSGGGNRRRLSEIVQGLPDFDDPYVGRGHLDDFARRNNGMGQTNYEDYGLKLTAQHLFCMAADSLTLPKYNPTSGTASKTIKDPSIHCDINSFEVRESLLYLWSSAKSQMTDDVLIKTLRLVTEHKETLRGNEVYLWYPEQDAGTQGMLRVINSAFGGRATYNFDTEPADSSHDDLYRFWDIPSTFVGANKLFVDVGSALGLTAMLVSYLYPGTTIVSIEPASPSWLIQNLNFRCNLSHGQRQYIHPILAGVGTKHHDDNDYMMKMIWRPSMTTATRSWNPEKEFDYAVDMELVVRLRTLRSILAEATPDDLPLGTPISVMNLDCEGCEYNLIPSMHETTFNSVGLILGRTNWGFIPTIKKPSSERGKSTHERLCTHYNFAKRCKECCEFPSLSVKPKLREGEPSELQPDAIPPLSKTVSEVAGGLCDGFDAWSNEQHLHSIPDDYGWNEMSAFAADT